MQTSHVLQSIRAKFGIIGIPVATGKTYYQVFALKKDSVKTSKFGELKTRIEMDAEGSQVSYCVYVFL